MTTTAVWTAAAACLSALLTSAAPQDDALRGDDLATDAEARFVVDELETIEGAASHAIRSLTSDDFSDLEFLRDELDGVRIVQLGENGHGMAESSLLKGRMVRFLHEELDFDVIAFEADLYQCANANSSAGAVDPTTSIFKCAFGVWHVEEVVPLFEHLRASRDTERPLMLAGFDVQPIGNNKAHRPAFLAQFFAGEDAAKIAALDGEFLELYALRDRSARRTAFVERRDELIDGYDGITRRLEERLENEERTAVRNQLLVARQTVQSIVAFLRMETATTSLERAEARNLGMAENVRFLADELFPGKKIIVWAHNTHIRHASEQIPVVAEGGPRAAARDMGTFLHERYGESLYTVGVYAYRGTAVNNARTPYDIVPPSLEHLESRLARSGYRVSFTSLRGKNAWAAEPCPARYNARTDQTLVPSDQYDALLFFADVTPPAFLY